MHAEPTSTKPAVGIGERIRNRIARQLDSSVVVTSWNEAILRIVKEANPHDSPEVHAESAKNWRILAEGMGVAASVIDITIAALSTGMGMNSFATKVGRWTPMREKSLAIHFDQGKSPARQRIDHTLSRAARVSPLIGLAGAAIAIRPARIGLSFAGRSAGIAGEQVTRIIRKITHNNASDGEQVLSPPAAPSQNPLPWYLNYDQTSLNRQSRGGQ